MCFRVYTTTIALILHAYERRTLFGLGFVRRFASTRSRSFYRERFLDVLNGDSFCVTLHPR